MFRLCLLFVGLLWLAGPPARAADGAQATHSRRWTALADTVFRHLAAPEMHYATAIAQDGQGFVWFATTSGLVRWDGYRSRTYHADAHDPSALPDNYVLTLFTDRRGRLWIGTATGGLARYDPQTDAFIRFAAGTGARDDARAGASASGPAGPSVSAMAADGTQGLWIGTSNGLDHLDLATGARRKVPTPGRLGGIKAVLQDPDGSLWLGTERGLVRRPPGGAGFVDVPLDVPKDVELFVPVLQRDTAGRLWIGTRPYGAFVIEAGQDRARAVHETGTGSRLETESVISFAEARPGEVWLGTGGGGIVVVDTRAGWQTRRLRNDPSLSSTLADDDVRVLHRDRSGLMWAGSIMAMNLHDPRQEGISTLLGAAASERPITAVQVPFVLATADDRVWLAAGDRGSIDILDPIAGRVAALRSDPLRPASALPRTRVQTMAEVPGGDVYIGTKQGLYRADARARQVVRVRPPGRAANAAVWALSVDQGVLWIGGLDGLWALDVSRSEAPVLLRHEAAAHLGGERVTAIQRGAGSALWVGTRTGLYRVDIASSAVEGVPADAADPAAFQGGYVASMLLDAQGRLWVALVGGGIDVLERHDAAGRPRFRRLGLLEGLPHASVNKLLQDAEGRVWASTDNGLAVIDPASFAIRALGERQGVAIREYWTNAGARTAAGELLFGGAGGLTVVRPAQTGRAEEPPALVVTEAHAGGKALAAGRFNGPGAPVRLDIDSGDERGLMIEFAALDFAAPEQSHYSYRLQGFDTGWVTTDASHRTAAYTNLPPGNYTLQLRGSSPEAPWPTSELLLPISVLPAWYQELWFRAVAALLALLGLAWAVQLRTAYLRRRQRELEAMVALRTAELEERGAELRQSQRQLEQIAYVDALTGLPNRRRFNQDLEWLLQAALDGNGHVTLLLLDLDRFKPINDGFGHDAGDALLAEMARRLAAALRQTDRVARLGGDEFAVLLVERGGAEELDPANADDAADSVCRRLVLSAAQAFEYHGHTLQVGASIGVARCPADALSADALYKCADLALYQAKAAGRNTWRWYEPTPGQLAG